MKIDKHKYIGISYAISIYHSQLEISITEEKRNITRLTHEKLHRED